MFQFLESNYLRRNQASNSCDPIEPSMKNRYEERMDSLYIQQCARSYQRDLDTKAGLVYYSCRYRSTNVSAGDSLLNLAILHSGYMSWFSTRA
jgi:hypothetical protein